MAPDRHTPAVRMIPRQSRRDRREGCHPGMILGFTKAAAPELQSIPNDALEAWGIEQEQRYLDAPWKKFEEILADPARWSRRHDLFPGCQVAAQGKQVILFRVGGSVLQVVRILHGAMDVPATFLNLNEPRSGKGIP